MEELEKLRRFAEETHGCFNRLLNESGLYDGVLEVGRCRFNLVLMEQDEYDRFDGIHVIGLKQYAELNALDPRFAYDSIHSAGLGVYSHKQTPFGKYNIFVGAPYVKEDQIPLERLIWHEYGHFTQDLVYELNGDTCESLVLEYHNVMCYENLCEVPFQLGSTLGKGNKRLKYGEVRNPFGTQKIVEFYANPARINELKGRILEAWSAQFREQGQELPVVNKTPDVVDILYKIACQPVSTNVNQELFANMIVNLNSKYGSTLMPVMPR